MWRAAKKTDGLPVAHGRLGGWFAWVLFGGRTILDFVSWPLVVCVRIGSSALRSGFARETFWILLIIPHPPIIPHLELSWGCA